MAGQAQPKPGIKVFLLDDHEIVRRGVKDMLESEPDIMVIGEAGTAASALARIPALMPDVAVLDVRLPDGDGVALRPLACSQSSRTSQFRARYR